MKRYRIEFSHISNRRQVPMFTIQKLDANGGWYDIDSAYYVASTAEDMIKQIIGGEREFVIVPVEITTIRA